MFTKMFQVASQAGALKMQERAVHDKKTRCRKMMDTDDESLSRVVLERSLKFLRHSRAGVSENSDFANYLRLPVVFDLPSAYRYHTDLSAQNA